MSESNEIICPWCDTEIVWDAELGPEEECPHCLNELGDYRSIALPLADPFGDPAMSSATREGVLFDEDAEAAEDELFDYSADDADDPLEDTYAMRVQGMIDEQADAPECPNCREYMLLSGTQVVDAAHFQPVHSSLLQQPVLSPPFHMNVFICPSCFKVETFLDESSQLRLVDAVTTGRADETDTD